MVGTKTKLKNRVLLPNSKFYGESNGAKKERDFISLFLS